MKVKGRSRVPSALWMSMCLAGLACTTANDEATTREADRKTMRIEFERSGGLAGMRLSLSIDTDTLPDSEAEEIEELVEGSDFYDQPEQIESPSGAADTYIYKVTIESEGRSHTVTTSDIGAPPELSRLLERLERMARRTRDK